MGPWKSRVGFDETGAAVSGLFAIEGSPTHPHSPPVLPIVDNIVGWFGTVGILEALRRRASEGGSYKVTVSLTRTVLWLLSLGAFDKGYAQATAGSSDEHAYVAPDLFTAETPLGTYQGLTDQLVLSRTPGAFRTVIEPRGSSKARVMVGPGRMSAAAKPRVVIIGGGFAGIAAARSLQHADAEVLIIDRRNHHIFQPLLYQVATAVLSSAEIAAPIRQLEVRQRNLNVLLAEVTGVSLADSTVDAAIPGVGLRKVAFDYLVVATGSRPSYFGHDEFARFAPGLKDLSDAETIRAKILSAFELADATEDEDERERQMTFVLVGAGPTGVELAASMADLVQATLRNNFHQIDPAKANIVLLDGASRVLPTFSAQASGEVSDRLQKLGVKVITGAKVETVDENGVLAGGRRIPSATVLWTAGVVASPIPGMLDAQTDRAGRALVDSFLRVSNAHRVFVVGRCGFGHARRASGSGCGAGRNSGGAVLPGGRSGTN